MLSRTLRGRGIYRKKIERKMIRKAIFDPLTTRIWASPLSIKSFLTFSERRSITPIVIPRSVPAITLGNHWSIVVVAFFWIFSLRLGPTFSIREKFVTKAIPYPRWKNENFSYHERGKWRFVLIFAWNRILSQGKIVRFEGTSTNILGEGNFSSLYSGNAYVDHVAKVSKLARVSIVIRNTRERSLRKSSFPRIHSTLRAFPELLRMRFSVALSSPMRPSYADSVREWDVKNQKNIKMITGVRYLHLHKHRKKTIHKSP